MLELKILDQSQVRLSKQKVARLKALSAARSNALKKVVKRRRR
jgi:hypothetical protein